MEQKDPEVGTSEIIRNYGRIGHALREPRGGFMSRRVLARTLAAMLALATARPIGAQTPGDTVGPPRSEGSSRRWWALFATGFASSILAHEGAHVAAAYAVGGRPSFGLNEGRPTIYSGVNATTEPRKQFVFSSAGLTVQSLIDEGILDAPHGSSRAGAFERGLLAGGLATSFFYVTIGRTGTVSDVDFMARTSRLNKTSITAIFGGLALAHSWRIAHNSRYADFFARPAPEGGLRVGVTLDP
jgi:hypothetical protein